VLEERRDQQYLRRPGDRAVRRSRTRKGLLRRLLSLGAQAALLGALWLIGNQVRLYVLTTPAFAVKTIAVRGNQRARTADLLALGSSVLSENIFRADLAKFREDVCRSPWVLDASVRRSLPSTIELTIREREPAAIVGYQGRAWLVDATGRRLAEYGPGVAEFDFPVLTGTTGFPRGRPCGGLVRAAAAGTWPPDARLRQGRPEIDLSRSDRLAVRLSWIARSLRTHRRDERNPEHAAVRNRIVAPLPDPSARDGGSRSRVGDLPLRFIAVMTDSGDLDLPSTLKRADQVTT
jgi:hypothetical protein